MTTNPTPAGAAETPERAANRDAIMDRVIDIMTHSESSISEMMFMVDDLLATISRQRAVIANQHGEIEAVQLDNERLEREKAERDAEIRRLTEAARVAARLARNWPEEDPDYVLERVYSTLATALNRENDAKLAARKEAPR